MYICIYQSIPKRLKVLTMISLFETTCHYNSISWNDIVVTLYRPEFIIEFDSNLSELSFYLCGKL